MKLNKANNGSLLFVLIVCFLIFLEICFNLCLFEGILGQGANGIGLFGTAVLIGLAVGKRFYKKTVVLVEGSGTNSYRTLNPAIWIVGMLIMSFALNGIWKKYPITAGASDIIPTLEVAVSRFLNGEMPYKTISKWGYDLPLTYLPLQWGPYILPDLLKFDYRWMAVAINFLAGIWIIRQSSKVNQPVTVAIPLLLLLNWTLIIFNNEGILANTVEMMVAGYYMMLIMGLAGKNAIVKGLMIGLCLMSRYSLVLWLPLWLFIEAVSGNRKQLITTLLVTSLFVTCVYVLPFLSRDPTIFAQGYHYYSKAALGEWTHVNEQQLPYHLYNGQGFAWLFYEHLNHYSLPDRIKSLQKAHLMLCLLTTVVLGVWYWFNRKNINHRIFIMASFKIYLAVFLAFIQVPYAYLMITGTFVSIAILAASMKYTVLEEPAAA